MTKSWQKFVASILLLSIVGTYFIIPPHRADALLGIADSTFNTPVGESPSSPQFIRNFILKPASRIIAAAIIRSMTNQVVAWIQGGGRPNFVQDVGLEATRAADKAGGEFLNKITGLNLCSNFGLTFRFHLRTPRLSDRAQCTVSGIVSSVKNFRFNKDIAVFYDDIRRRDFFGDDFKGGVVNQKFEKGLVEGIKTYLSLLEPQNTVNGGYDLASHEKLALELEAGGRRFKILDWNKGFKGFEVEEEVDDPDTCEPDENGKSVCQKIKRTVTKTPGQIAAGALQKSVDVGFDFTAVADELDEAISSIASALINKIINTSLAGSSGSGLEDRSISRIPFVPDLRSSLVTQVDDALIRITMTEKLVDDKITDLVKQIIVLKETCLATTPTVPCDQNKITSLTNEKIAQGDILLQLNGLFTKVFGIKDRFFSTTDANTWQDLSQGLSDLLQSVEGAIRQVANSPLPGQTTLEDPNANVIKLMDRTLERVRGTLTLLDIRTAAEKDTVTKTKFTTEKEKLQALIGDLESFKALIPSEFTDASKPIIIQAMDKIAALKARIDLNILEPI